jgi:SAM-dependent methyltransferase
VSFDRFAHRYEGIVDASTGDGSAYYAQRKADYLAGLVTHGFAGKVLDFGCGVGLVSRALATALPHAELHGFDPSRDSVTRVPVEVRARGRFVTDLGDLDRDYGVIVVANVLHHVTPAERGQAVAEVTGRLAPGGRLVVFEHNRWNPATRWVVATCPLDDDAVLLPRRETRQRLTDAGLLVERSDYVTFFPKLLSPLQRIEAYLWWLPLGAQYAVVGRKRR